MIYIQDTIQAFIHKKTFSHCIYSKKLDSVAKSTTGIFLIYFALFPKNVTFVK